MMFVPVRSLFYALLLALSITAMESATVAAQTSPAPVALSDLTAAARARTGGESRSALATLTPEVLKGIDSLEPTGSGRVPNYLRVLAPVAGAPQSLSTLVRALLYEGLVEPELKMTMGLRISQLNGSPYVAAHLQRFLGGSPRGRAMLPLLAANALDQLKNDDRLALRYAEALTLDVHGISDEDFRRIRASFNDGQIVELTMVVSFFNYFTRLAEGLKLPVETWVTSTTFVPPAAAFQAPLPRVNIVSDRQLAWAAKAAPAPSAPETRAALVNSQRAMMLTPAIGSAWMAHMQTTGASRGVDQALKLHVSFAVSTANGCRYCTLHQVQGLRRVGVSIDKLLQLQKDDSALSPRELTAVQFARALTRGPASTTDADYATLRTTFGAQGALEVVLQTCAFAFMNRFTDNLKLPSEDEAVAVYRQVYGRDAPRTK